MRKSFCCFAVLLGLAVLPFVWSAAEIKPAPVVRVIQNPYATVDWTRHLACKANLHTHTTLSDGRGCPAEVIDRYAALGYRVLALTDHDTMGPGSSKDHPERERTTWPWPAFGRDPVALGMVAVEGNEISRGHHIGSYFNNYGDAQVASADAALDEIRQRGGLAVLFHPGRYQNEPEWSVAWYLDRLRKHPHLLGIEIYNQGDRYPQDRKLWDDILAAMVSERPVWGFSNDDMHVPDDHLGRNWNVLMLPELSETQVRRAMENGVFFFVYAPAGHDGPPPPVIRSIAVDDVRGVIRLEVTGAARVEWISHGRRVHTGETISVQDLSGLAGYVRAVVYADDGKTLVGTQPFILQSRP